MLVAEVLPLPTRDATNQRAQANPTRTTKRREAPLPGLRGSIRSFVRHVGGLGSSYCTGRTAASQPSRRNVLRRPRSHRLRTSIRPSNPEALRSLCRPASQHTSAKWPESACGFAAGPHVPNRSLAILFSASERLRAPRNRRSVRRHNERRESVGQPRRGHLLMFFNGSTLLGTFSGYGRPALGTGPRCRRDGRLTLPPRLRRREPALAPSARDPQSPAGPTDSP
jgi:hypothetical protein